MVFWLLGDLNGATQWAVVWSRVALALALVWPRARELDWLARGDAWAATLGVPVARRRRIALLRGRTRDRRRGRDRRARSASSASSCRMRCACSAARAAPLLLPASALGGGAFVVARRRGGAHARRTAAAAGRRARRGGRRPALPRAAAAAGRGPRVTAGGSRIGRSIGARKPFRARPLRAAAAARRRHGGGRVLLADCDVSACRRANAGSCSARTAPASPRCSPRWPASSRSRAAQSASTARALAAWPPRGARRPARVVPAVLERPVPGDACARRARSRRERGRWWPRDGRRAPIPCVDVLSIGWTCAGSRRPTCARSPAASASASRSARRCCRARRCCCSTSPRRTSIFAHRRLLVDVLLAHAARGGVVVASLHDLDLAWDLATHVVLLDGRGGFDRRPARRRADVAERLGAVFGVAIRCDRRRRRSAASSSR